MTTLPPRQIRDPEKRLMILYAMSRLPGCDELQLLKFLFEYDLSNYIELRLTLHELCAQGQAARLPGQPFDAYVPTEAGVQAISMFKNRLPESTVRLIDDNAEAWRERFRREKQYKADYKPSGQGEICVTMLLREREEGAPELKIDLLVPNQELASKMCKNWEKQSGTVYGAIIRALSEDL